MVSGMFSLRGVISTWFCVARLQVWPARMWNPPTSPTSVVIGEIGVAQARSPAVALVVIRRVSDAQEVRLVIPGKLLVGVDVALDQQRDSALSGGPVKFVLVVKR